MTQLEPCPICGLADWPEGGMHAARAIHMRAHERIGERTTRPPFFQDRPQRQAVPLTWRHVAIVAVLMFGFVAMVGLCVWGIR